MDLTDEQLDALSQSFPRIDSAHPYQLGNGEGATPMKRPPKRPALTNVPFSIVAVAESSSNPSAPIRNQAHHNSGSSTYPSAQAGPSRQPESRQARSEHTGSNIPGRPLAARFSPDGGWTSGWIPAAPGDGQGPSAKALGKRKAVDQAPEYRSNQPAADSDSGSDDAPHVLGGVGAKLAEEARARATLPPPSRTRNYGRVPVSHFNSARGDNLSEEKVWPEGSMDSWITSSIYHAADTFNRYAYQKTDRNPSRPLIYHAPVAFLSMRQFHERQAKLTAGIKRYAQFLHDRSIPQGLHAAQCRRIVQTLTDIQEEEKEEMDTGVLNHLDGLLGWCNSLNLRTTSQPFYFICYARSKALWQGSIAQSMIMDPELVEPNKRFRDAATQAREAAVAEIESSFGAYPVHAVGIRAQRVQKGWDFRIFDSNYMSPFWKHSFKADGSNAVIEELASIEFLGGLVKHSLEALRHGKSSSGDSKKDGNPYKIVRNGGVNRATAQNPTGLCVQLSLRFMLDGAFSDMDDRRIRLWTADWTQSIRFMG